MQATTRNRLLIGSLIFVSVNAGAAVAVFDGVDWSKMTTPVFVVDCLKCVFLASGNLLTYLHVSKPNQLTTP